MTLELCFTLGVQPAVDPYDMRNTEEQSIVGSALSFINISFLVK